MPVHTDSTETQAAILQGWLGPNRGATAPASWQVEGWYDNPLDDDASQADFDGYTPAVHDADDWVMDDTEIATTDVVSLGTPNEDAAEAVRYWALRHIGTDTLGYSGPLAEKVYPVAGVELKIRPVIKVATQ